MRKLILICLFCSMICACYCHQKEDRVLPVSEEQVQTPEKEKTATTIMAEDPIPAAQPVSASKEKSKQETSQKTVVAQAPTISKAPAISSKATPAKESEPKEFDSAAAEKLIQAQRAAQTLKNPQPDTAVFKDESLISTSGRRVSPFAYEPVVQTKTDAPWSQEELKYGVYYAFVKAGTAYIKNRGLSTLNGRKAYLIQTTAFSAPVIDSVFKVRDVNYSWIDAENFYSLGYTQSLREGNYVRDEWITFDPANKRYYGEVKKKKEPRTIAGKMTIPVLDILSALYFVRAQNLEVGKDVIFDIINREEQYPLIVKVLKKETVKIAAGKFRCVVVEPQFRGEGIFVSKGKSLKVWLTDDQYKMPVKMESEVFIGSVSAELLEYKRN